LDLIPDHLDAISLTLLARYREVAKEMAPYRQRTIYEANSELSLFQLNEGEPMRWTKHSEKGREERMGVLEAKMVEARRITDAEVPGATISHLMDAAAVLWTARRVFARAAIRIPADPEWDEDGLRMELVR
jgi:predicted RNase H-like nuclease